MKNVAYSLILSTLVLGACSHYSDDLASMDAGMKAQPVAVAQATSPEEIAPAAGGAGQNLSQILARDYYAMARYENDKAYDYKAAKQYTEKAAAAAKGQATGPSRISSFDLPANRVGELTAARAELVTALKTQNTPENSATLAKAQTSFDCWIERAEEAPDDTHFAQCKNDFEQSMAMLIMPAAGTEDTVNTLAPTTFDIAFAPNSAVIDPASSKTIVHVAEFLSNPSNAAYTATLTGYAEGQGEFATSVVNARVNAIRDELIKKNVAADRLNGLVAPANPAISSKKVQIVLVSPQPTLTPNASTTTEYVPVTPIPVDPASIPTDAIVIDKTPPAVQPAATKSPAYN